MKRIIFLVSLIFSSLTGFSQSPTIDAGPDAIVCPPECATLTATFVGGGGNTTDYTIEDIPFAPAPYTGTEISLFDDDLSDALPIGFDFCFYGETYTNFYVCSNGWVGFTAGTTTSFTPAAIPSTDFGTPKNCIMGPWHDLNPGVAGTIRYETIGEAPIRQLVVTFQTVAFFSCTSTLNTQQIILYESSNQIENHIETKLVCDTWVGGRAVQGIHNAAGTEAVVNTGRNNTIWNATDESVRYTPLGEPVVEWYTGPFIIGEGPSISVCPTSETIYVAKLVSCGYEIAVDSVTVQAVCSEPPVMTKTDVTCFAGCDGTANAEPIGLAPFDILWDAAAGSQTTESITGLCAGTYSVTTTDALGNVQTNSVTIDEPTELVVTPTILNVSCAGASDGSISLLVTGGTPTYTYGFGPSAPGIVGSFSDLPGGDYNITVTDANGCANISNYIVTETPLPIVGFIADVTSGCEPLLVTFTSTGDVGTNCTWTFGDGGSSGSCGTDVTHNYENEGINDVSLTVIDAAGCTDSYSVVDFITVFDVPNADFDFNPRLPNTLNADVNFIDKSTGADSYFWVMDSVATSTEAEPTIAFPEVAANYNVKLTVTTDEGCSDEVEKEVVIYQEQLIFAPNAFTPDGDTYNEKFLPYFTGIDIYDYHLVIYNRWGETMFESYDSTVGWDGTFGGEVVPSGSYVWFITTADIASDSKLEFKGTVSVLK